MAAQEPTRAERTTLTELCLLFLRLGTTAFGGPAAHIAMMQDEVVARRKWLSEQAFLDLVAATNLIPGPNSTELAIHIGAARRGLVGLVVAGVSFIVPAMLITAACGFAYVEYGALPAASWLLYGVKPVILAVVLQAIWGLTPKAAKTRFLQLLGVSAVVLTALGVDELAVLFGVGAVALAHALRGAQSSPGHLRQLAPVLPVAAATGLASTLSLSSLFWVFLKIGSVLFGSGYVLLAFLRADLVERLHWLSEAQLIDAVAVGQVTPGPVFTTATFIGYVLLGPEGALVATAGIFAPAFVFVALSAPLVPRLRASKAAAGFLDGVVVASLALMAVVTFQLGRAALVDVPTTVLFVAAAILLVRYKLNSTWLVLAGAVSGYALHAAAR